MKWLAWLLIPLAAGAVALRVTETVLVPWALIAYLAVSGPTALVYAWDKRRAEQGGGRVPESTLHVLELLCGWPGALIAQRAFHHKTRKVSYQVVFWLIVAAHTAAWCWWWLRPEAPGV